MPSAASDSYGWVGCRLRPSGVPEVAAARGFVNVMPHGRSAVDQPAVWRRRRIGRDSYTYASPDSSFSWPVLSPKRSTGTPSFCSIVNCRLVIGVVPGS